MYLFRANQLALVKKLEKTVSKPEVGIQYSCIQIRSLICESKLLQVEIKKPKVEKADLTFVDARIAQKTAGRAKRSMVGDPSFLFGASLACPQFHSYYGD